MSLAFIIPCFNESERFQTGELDELLAKNQDITVWLVNDGSTDQTEDMLQEIAQARHPRVRKLSLHPNRGKAEAVRLGLLEVLKENFDWVGYADADFATPASELLRLAEFTRPSDFDVVLASRVRLLGTRIERRAIRHYLGRIFATLASWTLRLPVYDTQCGAKLFRVNVGLQSSLAAPFSSRWAFDVDLIGRLRIFNPTARFVEVPLQQWVDVKGSKVTPGAFVRAGFDLLKIGFSLRRLRQKLRRGRLQAQPSEHVQRQTEGP